jgi:hypothetical protein
VECQILDAGFSASFAPRRSETRFRPRCIPGGCKDRYSILAILIEKCLQWLADWYLDASIGLTLTQANSNPVICAPRKSQQITLTLTGPERQHESQTNVRRCGLHKGDFIFDRPNTVYST